METLSDNMDKLYIMLVDIVNAERFRIDCSSTTEKNTPVLNLKLSSTSPKPVTKSFFFSEQYWQGPIKTGGRNLYKK